MENLQNDTLYTQNLYRDMQKRTGGEIYIGVVGPVRTGKSTFIKRFMDVAVLPYLTEEAEKKDLGGSLEGAVFALPRNKAGARGAICFTYARGRDIMAAIRLTRTVNYGV